MNKILN